MPEIVSPATTLLLWAVLGYLLGSIPFGVLVTRAMGLGDVRSIGSGNIGATNVLRTGSKGAALATLLLDGGKGALAVLLARAVAPEDAAQLAGAMAFLGHCFPVWLGFRGGKGVATALGLLLAVAWPVGLAACATWAATAALLRISSLSALVAAVLSPLWAVLLGRGEVVVLAIALAALILVRHRANIARLLAGTEPRIGRR
ncbi:Acyl-phosphate:glycerol-3-phosphate O-acyltransferase PlsY [Rubellimicrobium mesophilum DSM 19309]|uniref:Glycerol-3-phosphate acyltransferase n=1 Tax=Rubellimicrobium mesophilum DSM 19309 TaxID=442562 RepID=A0A017HKE7_9RHOB|nr:glycerol-3-phosphate 1-O-acyltransferase PlsY [Rubellimicrobium mesophilum]EYD74613.1 Acyl-phosphate:glycerol-3-phosphate O-acyltransferase PlsY [Rubellimicrobium mesophilum DSM 19309]